MSENSQGSKPLSAYQLFLAALCPLSVILLSFKYKLGVEKMVIIASSRAAFQLFFAGYVLLGFIFSINSPILVFSYILIMAFIAAVEVTARQLRTYSGHFLDSVASIIVGGGFISLYGSLVVFHPTPWWESKVLIPTMGMIIGNAISGPAVSVDRLLSEVCEKAHEIEIRLSCGATAFESVLPGIKSSILTAIMPLLNMMSVVGLVSIPGMMVGQLLGGSGPLASAEYQLAILYLISATSSFSTYIAVSLAIRHAVFDNNHRLTLNKIHKKEKMDTFSAIFHNLYSLFNNFASPNLSPIRSENYQLVSNNILDQSNSRAIEMIREARTGKVSVDIINQEPTNSIENEDPLLVLDRVNVLSGEEYLFTDCGLTFTIFKRDRIVLSGPSGIGKTRLLRALSGLDCIPLGTVSLYTGGVGVVSHDFNENHLWRCRVIYVPQALPTLTGSPKLLLAECFNYISRKKLLSRGATLEDCSDLIRNTESALGLSHNKLDMSGGERQRAAIAISLILASNLVSNCKTAEINGDPGSVVLLLDEPTSACDPENTLAVEKVLRESQHTILMITHDVDQSLRFSSKRILFNVNNPTVKNSNQIV